MAGRRPRDWPDAKQRKREREEAALQIQDDVTLDILGGTMKSLITAYTEISELTYDAIRTATRAVEDARWVEAHQEVGKKALANIRRSFGQTVGVGATGATVNDAAYRTRRSRYGNGKLKRSLANPEMMEASHLGLKLINRQFLDRAAAHWYRLNYGAGPRGANSRQGKYQMMFNDGGQGPTLGLLTGPSRHGVMMPPGGFVSPTGVPLKNSSQRRGKDAFWPRKPGDIIAGTGLKKRRTINAPQMTAGIAARNFLDAGVRSIARDLPKEYDKIVRESLQAQLKGKRVSIDTVLPQRPALRVRRVEKASGEKRRYKGGVSQYDLPR